ncbi:PilZ domain-containing protein [Desulfonema magnum]|uniref:PilZ domain-containing protein n=1 Tax=Desulfonema magnum TaxID=45655 RepID=A0A975GRU5_9BACT|nr:PilZ domain-containing protein [Desulfonema magnum]QTA91305.1 PilZ domain-containing protein [Desulfonema magnum]
MKDYQKINAQLNEELKAMRQRVAALELKLAEVGTKPDNTSEKFVKRSLRKEFEADIEFIGDFDIIEAKGINFSEGGICFELSENLPFEMRFEYEGKLRRRRAHLIWVKHLPEGGYRFGLKFIPSEPHSEI